MKTDRLQECDQTNQESVNQIELHVPRAIYLFIRVVGAILLGVTHRCSENTLCSIRARPTVRVNLARVLNVTLVIAERNTHVSAILA